MSTPTKTLTWLFNPFHYLAGTKALALGLAAILLTALIAAHGNAHFDGVLDTHVGAAAPLWLFLAEGVIDWLCLAATIWIAGKLISRTAFRAIDVLGTQALARWPTLLISLIVLPRAFQRFSNELLASLQQGKLDLNVTDTLIFGLAVTIMIPLICWTIYLMYKSFSVSCNVTGGKAIGTFIGALLIAEFASKVLLATVILPAAAVPAVAQSAAAAPAQSDAIANSGAHFVGLLGQSNFTAAVAGFDDTMKTALPESSLRSAWAALQKKFGAFEKQVSTRTTNQAGYQIAFVTCQFAHTNLDVKVVFDSRTNITGLFFVASQTN